MAGESLQLELCSPTHAPVTYAVSEAIIPGAAGVFTVLPGHTPVLTTLGKGVLIAYPTTGKPHFFAVHDGFAEVLDNRISILADTLELAENIDSKRAESASERAQLLLRKPLEDTDMQRAEAAFARSLARLQAHARQEY